MNINLEMNKHLDTCALTHAIQDQSYIRHDVAAHLAQTAVERGYTGGQVIAGVGDYGLDTALYVIIWQVDSMWHSWLGYRLTEDRWHALDSYHHKDIKTLRWLAVFNHNARLCEVNPTE